MIHSYISIGLNNGKKVQYVRNVTTDTNGVNARYYGYEGPGYQELGLKHVVWANPSGLTLNKQYYFKVNIDGAGEQEYSIIPKKAEVDAFWVKNKYVQWETIINELNRATKSDGAEWSINNHGDIRCQSTSESDNTSIALAVGTTGTDLFNSIEGFTDFKAAVPGDQLADQTGAGKVLGDYDTILGFIEAELKQGDLALKEIYLEFPEDGGDVKSLIRKNNNESQADIGKTVTRVPIQAISEITIVEKSMMR